MSIAESWSDRLARIYPDRTDEAIAKLDAALSGAVPAAAAPAGAPRWDERDVVMISYADILRSDNQTPLATLNQWLTDRQLNQSIRCVHLLPFCPYTSDDGFSVVDYLEVDPASGTWDDIARLGHSFDLMFDLVLNHCSQASEWFQAYLRGEAPYNNFFIDVDPSEDLTLVVRPRSLPLLSPYPTAAGVRHVWTTFSADQVDLNYGEPAVLAEMLRVLVEYARRGARIIRLDAVAFLWKQIGSNCIHLAQTHQVVKLCREVLEAAAPRTLVLTETNVPHTENISYFGQVDPEDGQGDEAHMVYNFSLPPLLLDAFASGDASPIRNWLMNLADPPPGCTFFNFTASHDGVGVRPLEGLVSDERFDRLIRYVEERGGLINTRRTPDGRDVPYELNITYVDALAPDADQYTQQTHARRFLASQAVMLALKGMPAVYFHSLVGTRNDYAGVEQSGQNRRINRHKYTVAELEQCLGEQDSLARLIFEGYTALLATRIAQPAFHPDAAQQVVDVGNDHILAFQRSCEAAGQTILVTVNVSAAEQSLDLPEGAGHWIDLATRTRVTPDAAVTLKGGDFKYWEQRTA